ncbi:MAG: DNA cytosine methyltransferase [Pseudomonadota bacterium]
MAYKLKLLDLFSGIGGFSLGLERTGGFETVAFCEIEEFPRKVLAKHWPEVPCYEDVRKLSADALRRDGISVDAICGGFPCQDISTAGKGSGIEGERSGLWREYSRLIGELQPQIVFVENVAALLSRGLDRVLGDLAAFGYDAEWHCIPASAVGAHHRRDRIWIMAYATGERCGKARDDSQRSPQRSAGRSEILAHAHEQRLEGWQETIQPKKERAAYAGHFGPRVGGVWRNSQWDAEPNVGRVADGIPARAHRLKALGNAVVPQIPELLGNAYLESIGWRRAA